MGGEATGTQWTPESASADGIVSDFYSDMKTIPTDGMLQAMLTARVGDEQKGKDPTMNKLCARVADQVRGAIHPPPRYALDSRLVAVEQTTNLGGGGVWPLEQLTVVATVAKEGGLATYMGGARLFNTLVKSGFPVRDYRDLYESVWINLTKGLGSFAGAVRSSRAPTRSSTMPGNSSSNGGRSAAVGIHCGDRSLRRRSSCR